MSEKQRLVRPHPEVFDLNKEFEIHEKPAKAAKKIAHLLIQRAYWQQEVRFKSYDVLRSETYRLHEQRESRVRAGYIAQPSKSPTTGWSLEHLGRPFELS